MIFSYFLDSYFFSYGEFGELIMKLSRAALRPLLAAHERGALPLVGAAWGVTARKASHNASNAMGVAAGKMGRNSINNNAFCRPCLSSCIAPRTLAIQSNARLEALIWNLLA